MKKLAHLKRAINRVFVPVLGRACPKVEPTRNVTQMVVRIFDRFKANLKVQEDRFYKDQNFPKLIDAVEKALVYIAEKDGHYRGQLAYLLMAVTGEVEFAFKLKRQRDPTYTLFEFHKWLIEHPTELKKA